MTNLSAIEYKGQIVVDSRLIAIELGIQHKNFLATIEKYIHEIEEDWGQVAFETQTVTNSVGASNLTKFAYLTEPQATLLMTYSRNTEQVRQCKRQLVKAFEKAKSRISSIPVPRTFAEALQLAADQAKQLEEQQSLIASLELENEQLSEAVDELFNYSSIIRVAKFNNCSETNFRWRRLKTISEKMGIEIKRVPCPRFEYKNLYSHDVWRVAYPSFKLPETTTLVIYSGDSK